MITAREFLKIAPTLMAELMAKSPKRILMAHHRIVFQDYIQIVYGIKCIALGVVEGQVWTSQSQLIRVPKEL